MTTRSTRVQFLALAVVASMVGLPSALLGGTPGKFPRGVLAPGASNPLPAPKAASAGANFPTHSLATAPLAMPQTGSRTPSDDPRSQIIAERLSEQVAAIRARQEAAAEQKGALQTLRARNASRVEARFRSKAGTPRFVRGKKLEHRVRSLKLDPQADRTTARRFLRQNRRLFALDDPDTELSLVRKEKDRLGRTHVRFSQRYAGLEVWPADLTVHLDADGDVELMNGAYVATPRGLGTKPSLSADAASQYARTHVDAVAATPTSNPDLIVYAPGDRPPRLAWRLVVHKSIRFDMLVVVDAEDGEILTSFNRSQTQNVVGSGVDLVGQTRALNAWSENNVFYLTDTSKQMFDPASNPPGADTSRGTILIQDAVNQPPGNDQIPPNIAVVQSNSATTGWLPDGVSAAFGFSQVYDYFLTVHGRDSLDGNGGKILAVVRFGQNFDNAFYNGALNVMAFGTAKPYAAALDIVGHELSHGVTFTTSDLIYRDQPGALNESMSDIFGEMVESFESGQAPDWLTGTVFPEPSRSLSDPGSIEVFAGAGRFYPEKFSEYFGANDPFLDQLQNRDNGGVHINSSIPNHAFYQLAVGLPGAIGATDAAAIFYRANTVHLTQNSQFIDARLACIQSAEELFGAGSAQALKTAEAFDFVEIVDAPGSPDPPTFPGTQGDDSTLFLFLDTAGFQCSNFGGEYCVGRRELAQGDDPGSGVSLNTEVAAATRISVTGDGSLAVFVNTFGDVCVLDTLFLQESCLLLPSVSIFVSSVAVSPTGRFYAAVLYDTVAQQPDNIMRLVEPQGGNSFLVTDFTLVSPALDGGTLASVKFADALDFTSDEQFIVYDALNEITVSGGGTVDAWSIYALDRVSGTTYALVPPYSGLDFGFPALSQRSDNFMTFDVFDGADSTVHAMDLNTGQAVPVGATQGYGVPSYVGDDTAIVYSMDNVTSGLSALSGFSLVEQSLEADSLTPQGGPVLWLFDALYGTVYRRGTFDSTPLAECEDGRDNDGNGDIDFPADAGCSAASDPLEEPENLCLGVTCVALDACHTVGTCDPGTGLCSNPNAVAGTACGDTGDACTNQDQCDGAGACTDSGFVVVGTACGDAGDACTNQDQCDGAGACTDNGFVVAGTACGDAGTECSAQDSCDGSGSCLVNHLPPATSCGDAGDACTNQDQCDGAGACTDSGFVVVGTFCGSAATECSAQDSCDGSGSCLVNHFPAATACGDAGSQCTNQDLCDGAGTCSDNGLQPDGAVCDDGDPGTPNDTCSSGVCIPVPEPSVFALQFVALAVLGALGSRRRRVASPR